MSGVFSSASAAHISPAPRGRFPNRTPQCRSLLPGSGQMMLKAGATKSVTGPRSALTGSPGFRPPYRGATLPPPAPSPRSPPAPPPTAPTTLPTPPSGRDPPGADDVGSSGTVNRRWSCPEWLCNAALFVAIAEFPPSGSVRKFLLEPELGDLRCADTGRLIIAWSCVTVPQAQPPARLRRRPGLPQVRPVGDTLWHSFSGHPPSPPPNARSGACRETWPPWETPTRQDTVM